MRRYSLIALSAGLAASPVLAATSGSFADGGNTLVSAMMMFLGNNEKVYILDKAEGNAAQISGHPAWGAVWDIATHQSTVMDVKTNVFCSSGMHLPNGSFITLGGNGAVGRGGNIGSDVAPGAGSATWDSVYQDFDGTKSIRVLNPCTNTDDFTSSNCQWFDDPTLLSMHKSRWYSAAEATGTGEVVIIGGFVNGGYVNRNYPNTDPEFEGGAAECTYEFYPPRNVTPPAFNFLIQTSGLNAYAHSFLMASGLMFVQANVSTALWDYETNTETPLPAMPGNVVRVYPASGAVAMLPLTVANNYSQTILFCGGSDMPEYAFGDYSFPFIDTWNYPASTDCQRITPEPQDGSAPVYIQDDDMLEGRTMGQFIILPNGKLLVVNGALNGTAGYSQATLTTKDFNQMPWGESLSAGPVLTPALYDPSAPAGKRWSNEGFATSNIPRLYHSSAILLPDASVLIAGSNPNVDVNTSTIFPTTYKAEIFYPPYFSAKTRPVPTGVPSTISYGGNPFDITIPATSYTGDANAAAGNTTIVLHRGGFTTHAMNMGQRLLQLNNSFTVQSNGQITFHVAQAPPNPNLFQPGPAYLYVVVAGIPSNGTYVIVGNGVIGAQPTAPASSLPASILASASVSGTGSNSTTNTTNNDNPSTATSHTGAIIGGAVGAIIVLGLLGAAFGICMSRRRRHAAEKSPSAAYAMSGASAAPVVGLAGAAGARGMRSSDSSAFVPLQQSNYSEAWNGSTASLTPNPPYRDDLPSGRASETGMSMEYDPYSSQPMHPHGPSHLQQGEGGRPPYRY